MEIDWSRGVNKVQLKAVCHCGMDRKPERKVRNGLSLLLCGRCGKPTTERK